VELEKVSGEKDVEATESPSPIPHLQSSAAVNGTTSAQVPLQAPACKQTSTFLIKPPDN